MSSAAQDALVPSTLADLPELHTLFHPQPRLQDKKDKLDNKSIFLTGLVNCKL